MANMCGLDDSCQCKSEVSVQNLCAMCANVCFQNSKNVMSDEMSVNSMCAQNIQSLNVKSENLNANDVCLQRLLVKDEQVTNLAAQNLCAVNANFDHLCVSDLKVQNFKPCNTVRAYVGYNTDTLYTLGAILNFDSVLDNPSNLFSLSPSKFTAPVAGYYEFSMFLAANQLNGSTIITGVPVGQLSVYVNGVERKAIPVPFLGFAIGVKGLLSADFLLNAGDVLTMALNVLIQDPALGLVPYAGTMVLNGGPLTSIDPASASLLLKSELCNNVCTDAVVALAADPGINAAVAAAVNSLLAPSSDPISPAQATAEIAAVNQKVAEIVALALGGVGTPAQAAIAAAAAATSASVAAYVAAALTAANIVGPALSAVQVLNLLNAMNAMAASLGPVVIAAVASAPVQTALANCGSGVSCAPCKPALVTCEPFSNPCQPVVGPQCLPCISPTGTAAPAPAAPAAETPALGAVRGAARLR